MTRPQLAGFAAVAATWGCTWIVIRGQIETVPAAWSVTWRFAVAAAALALWARSTDRVLKLPAAGHRLALALGLLQFVLNFNLVYAAEMRVTSGLVAVVFALLVASNAMFARAFLGERLTPALAAGLVIGVVGVALMFADEIGGLSGGRGAVGLVMAVGAVLAASAANIAQAGPLGRRLPVEALLAWSMLYGAIGCLCIALATAGPPRFEWSAQYVGGLAFLALGATVLAFLIYYPLIRSVGAARAAYVNVVTPVIAMALSTVYEGYRWTSAAMVGAALVVGGVALALRGGKK